MTTEVEETEDFKKMVIKKFKCGMWPNLQHD